MLWRKCFVDKTLADKKLLRRASTLLIAPVTLLLFITATAPMFSQEADWAVRVRALIGNNRLDQAMSLINEWINAYPRDLDARAWHARVQAWTNHWTEAEAEYRDILLQTPNDVDVMTGLSDVLAWQKRFREALAVLEHACNLAPERSDCRLRLARVQQQLGQTREARNSYREILARDSRSRDARAGLAQLREDGKHELRFGFEADLLNYASNASTLTTSLHSRWSRRWSSYAAVSQYRRFDENATRFDADATLQLASKNAFTVGGSAARDAGVIPKSEARFEYDKGIDVSSSGPIRGLELLYQQRWVWYQGAHLLVLSPGAILYFPNDWNWLVRLCTTRSHFSGAGSNWKQGGWTRLTFPLTRKVSGQVLFAAGTENFGVVDQIREFSARAWGGGLKIRVASGQEVLGYGQYQSRSRGQSEASIGVSYAFRF
ncbi:MAG TPA: tetratricopeptide repeat protein [Acidobacteriota bacterium]|nr:tetratricopeptide repeat protein [Acidobacteriota bacterium]